MKLIIVILAAFLCGITASLDSSIDIDVDVTTINPKQEKANSKDSENSGDDESSGDVQGDSSGSGSGEMTTTARPVVPTTEGIILARRKEEENVVKVVTVKKVSSTKSTASPTSEPDHVSDAPKSTEKVQEILVTTSLKSNPTTTDDNLLGGGIGEGNVEASKQERKGLRVLTKEVIAAVIVGGICAIILIAFLVYRLRKRDEGSYVLTDSAYKDTNKLRGDPGKEAFV